ncbi:MAG: hypothetical protein ABI835_13120 [Chloroflexota bacterium]
MAAVFKEKRGIFSGLVIVTLAVILSVSGLAVVLNNNCQRAFWDGLAVYPSAEKTSEESVFLGIQRAVYHSPDSVEAVEAWYTTADAARMRNAVLSGNFRNTEQQNWIIDPDAQGGSIITLKTTCP